MKRTLCTILCLLLALLIGTSTVAYAEPAANGSGEDSGANDVPSPRANHFYWDPLSRFFRLFDMPAPLRVLFAGEAAHTPTPQASAAPQQGAQDDAAVPAPTQEELARAAEVLAGQVIGLDPGHQSEADYGLEAISPDSELTKIRQSEGCYGVRTRVPESRINLLVAQKVQALLESCGATVVLTRTGGEVSLSNVERALMMNQSGAALWLRIHCNFCTNPELSGACMLIPSSIITPVIYEHSLSLAECIAQSFGAGTGGSTVELVTLENQAGFNWSTIPVAAIEMGNLSNASDDALLNSDAYQTRCAIGIFNGIVEYLARTSLSDSAQLSEPLTEPDADTSPDTEPEPDGNRP